VAYRTVCLAVVFGHIHDEEKWELGDGEAVCFRIISLFLSVSWLEKLMLNHGAFVVVLDLEMYRRMIVISTVNVVTELLTVLAFVCFHSLSFVTSFIVSY
jgi:hypothetical protein